MLEQIKELCIFMICGQTLLYFQSGKKYEKICRMILELLVLAGIVGMILNFLQSLGFRKGEMEAAGGAVAGMQQSMEEALSKQLGAADGEEDFLSGEAVESLLKKYTLEEIKSRYNYFAQQYGMEIQNVEQRGEKLQVFLKVTDSGLSAEGERTDGERRNEEGRAGNVEKIAEIEAIEIGEITLGESEVDDAYKESEEKDGKSEAVEKATIDEKDLESFRRQLALVFAMEEEKLEVILID